VPRPVPPDNSLSLTLTDINGPHNLMRKLQGGTDVNKLLMTQLPHSRHKIERLREGDLVDIQVVVDLVEELTFSSIAIR
jgi:hypothetical protein